MTKVHVLFVCTGNICRSPIAQGVFNDYLQKAKLEKHIVIDSAGTHAFYANNTPEPMSQTITQLHGIDISQLRSRKICKQDYEYFDYILAADRYNYAYMLSECDSKYKHKIELLMKYAPVFNVTEIPDPYIDAADMQEYEIVFDMINLACKGLLERLKKEITNVHDT